VEKKYSEWEGARDRNKLLGLILIYSLSHYMKFKLEKGKMELFN